MFEPSFPLSSSVAVGAPNLDLIDVTEPLPWWFNPRADDTDLIRLVLPAPISDPALEEQ